MISSKFSLKQLEAFVWVADLGSFRKAARHLNTTQPNISARISAMEKTLDVVLMLRDAGSVRVTEKGAEILAASRQVLHDAERVVEIADRPDLVDDRLRLGVTELVACTWLHDFLRQLKAAYPSLAVELTVDLSRTLEVELGANALDLTIQNGPFDKVVSGQIEAGQFPYVWAIADPAVLGRAGPLGVKDLSSLTILTHARHTQAFTELMQHAESKSLATHRLAPSNSMTSCVQMALDGMGVTLLPRALIRDHLTAGRLCELDVDWLPRPLRFAARFHANKASHFVAHAADMAAKTSIAFQADTR